MCGLYIHLHTSSTSPLTFPCCELPHSCTQLHKEQQEMATDRKQLCRWTPLLQGTVLLTRKDRYIGTRNYTGMSGAGGRRETVYGVGRKITSITADGAVGATKVVLYTSSADKLITSWCPGRNSTSWDANNLSSWCNVAYLPHLATCMSDHKLYSIAWDAKVTIKRNDSALVSPYLFTMMIPSVGSTGRRIRPSSIYRFTRFPGRGMSSSEFSYLHARIQHKNADIHRRYVTLRYVTSRAEWSSEPLQWLCCVFVKTPEIHFRLWC